MNESTSCLPPGELPDADQSLATWALWVTSAALAAAVTYLLYDARPGINCCIATAALGMALLLVERPGLRALLTRRYMAIATACALSGAIAITASGFVQGLLLAAIATLASVATRLGAGVAPEQMHLARIATAPFVAPVTIARESSRVMRDGLRAAGNARSAAPLRGVVLAAAILVVFLFLLGEADPTFETMRNALLNVVSSLSGFGRVTYFATTGFVLLGFLGITRRPPQHDASRDADAPHAAIHTDGERLIILGSVAGLFGAFLVLQMQYLFGNPGATVGSGVTFAQAVHRGFGEISIVVTLTSVIILLLERHAARGARDAWVRATGCVVLGECLLLLGSAYLRLAAYEAVYGYTIARVCVRLYIVFLATAVLLVAIEFRHSVQPGRLGWRMWIAGLGILGILGYWNYSGWIVRANVGRYLATGRIDTDYLASTGADAVPDLLAVLPRLRPDDRAAVAAALRVNGTRALHTECRDGEWFEWNARRSAACNGYKEMDDVFP